MNDVDNGRDEHVWIHGLSDVRLKTGAFSARYVFFAVNSGTGNRGNGRDFTPKPADPETRKNWGLRRLCIACLLHPWIPTR